MTGWLSELINYRELLVALTLREIKVRYKQTLLGAAWAILQPASLALIFTIVFSIILNVNSSGVPYPIFAYSALVPWTFFSNSISFGSLSVVNNGNLVTKVFFPREILPLSSVGAALFDFLIASLVLVILFLIYGINLNFYFAYILLIVPSILLLTIGLSFIFSTINVLYRDIRFVVPLLLQIWLYLTPVIYSTADVPERYRIFFKLNPLSSLFENFRKVTVFGSKPDLGQIALDAAIALIVFIIGYWFFKKYERIFADVM